MELRKESPTRFFRSAWEKLDGVEGFERLRNSFKKKFRADSWEGLSSEDILKKTQAPEAKMRAAMGLVDEYVRGDG